MLEECVHTHQNLVAKHQFSSIDKGHERLEIRKGQFKSYCFFFPNDLPCFTIISFLFI